MPGTGRRITCSHGLALLNPFSILGFIEAARRRDCDDAARIMREHLARTAGRVRHNH